MAHYEGLLLAPVEGFGQDFFFALGVHSFQIHRRQAKLLRLKACFILTQYNDLRIFQSGIRFELAPWKVAAIKSIPNNQTTNQ